MQAGAMQEAQSRPIRQQDVFVKARLLAEGVRIREGGKETSGWKLPKQSARDLAGIESTAGEAVLREQPECSGYFGVLIPETVISVGCPMEVLEAEAAEGNGMRVGGYNQIVKTFQWHEQDYSSED